MTKRQWISLIAMALGVVCIAASAYLLLENQTEEQVAETVSAEVVSQLQEILLPVTEETMEVENVPQEQVTYVEVDTPESIMIPEETASQAARVSIPTIRVEDVDYYGMLSLPALGLNLPVAAECDDDLMSRTPCVYLGSLKAQNLIIIAHNYQSHFGKLNTLSTGAKAVFVDGTGTMYSMTMTDMEYIDDSDIHSLISGDWQMTLITCVYGDNDHRVVCRFQIDD
ncbi:MAG: sortase [Eubacteriales bacterium]